MNNTGKPYEDTGIIPLPLVIGVTGHRDLREEDLKPLEAQVGRIFAELKSRYPSTPLMLLSPLAEGADRLVARVALEKEVRLFVPLPMSQALYEEDFQTGASRDEFNQLLLRAESWFELPLLKGAREEEVRQQGPARDRQYAQVGAYIALHSQILIALWDGRDSKQVGSTAQVVQFQLHGVPEPYAPARSPLDEPESGAVYHIVTPRVKNPTPAGPFELSRLLPGDSTYNDSYYAQDGDVKYIGNGDHTGKKRSNDRSLDAKQQEFDRILQRLDYFNCDWIDHQSHLTQQQQQSQVALFDAVNTIALPAAFKRTLDCYANVYAIADTLAIHFGEKAVGTQLLLFWLAFIAVVFFDVFAHLKDLLGLLVGFFFLVSYLVILAVAIYSYSRATRGHYKDKYLDYRALAEGLRVQFFWRLADVPNMVPTHYLRKQKSELDWIRNSVRVTNLLCEAPVLEQKPPSSSVVARDERYQWILKQWVEQQSTYFTRATKRDHTKLAVHERRRFQFLTSGVFLALVLLALQGLQLKWPLIDTLTKLIDILIVFMSLALVAYALNEGYSDKRAYAEQYRQYQHMSHLFWLASQRLQDSLEQGKPQETERIIRLLGEEALAENEDWVIMHRARPIHVPLEG